MRRKIKKNFYTQEKNREQCILHKQLCIVLDLFYILAGTPTSIPPTDGNNESLRVVLDGSRDGSINSSVHSQFSVETISEGDNSSVERVNQGGFCPGCGSSAGGSPTSAPFGLNQILGIFYYSYFELLI